MTLQHDWHEQSKRVVAMVAIAGWLSIAGSAGALETDQFTVPRKPLADIGPQISQHVHETLATIVGQLNAELDQLTKQYDAATSDSDRAAIQTKITQALSGRTVANRLYKALGVGVPETTLEIWVQKTDFKQDAPVLHEVSCAESVTGICLQRPLVMIGLAPTLNMFGHYLGTDKIGHFMQQGYESYEIDMKGRADGLTLEQRRAKIVAKGKDLENGVFGMLLSGIYSNADLAADYAGYKFFLNLAEPVQIGLTTQPPILIVENQRWKFNPQITEPILEPFITDHLNEALNPCEYEDSFQNTVKENVALRATDALHFYHTTAEREVGHLEQLSTWYGEDYGHSGFDHLITLSNVMGLKTVPGVVVVQERSDSTVQ